jgi:hypothetical protein
MSWPMMCPVCGTYNFYSISYGESIHPFVQGQARTDVNFLIFACEDRHIFLTIDGAYTNGTGVIEVSEG